MVAAVVAVLNVLGALLPQVPALIDEIRGHPELNDNGRAALALLDAKLAADDKAVQAVQPLPTPKA
jgi:hypothetical protein